MGLVVDASILLWVCTEVGKGRCSVSLWEVERRKKATEISLATLRPLVSVLQTWDTNRPVHRVGGAKQMASTLRLRWERTFGKTLSE